MRLTSTYLLPGVAFLIAWAGGLASVQAQTRSIGIYAAGPGSAFLPYARGLAAYLSSSGIVTDVRQTAGSIENIKRLRLDPHALAPVFMGSAFEAYTGTGAWTEGVRFSGLRALFPMYETSFQWAALRSSELRGLQDLTGKRVGVGPAGGPAALYFAGLSDALHLAAVAVNGQPAALVAALVAGRIDALWQGAPPPIPALAEVLRQAPAMVFGLTEAEQSAMLSRFPFLTQTRVSSGTYKGQTAILRAVGAWNFVLVDKAFPEADAYRITRAVLSASDPRKDIDPTAAGTRADRAPANTFLPFHPGAIRYYRERGIRLMTPDL